MAELGGDDDESDEDPAAHLREIRRRVRFSDRSQRVLDDSDHLLKTIKNRRPQLNGSASMSTIPRSSTISQRNEPGDQSVQDRAERTFLRSKRSVSPDGECAEQASTYFIQILKTRDD